MQNPANAPIADHVGLRHKIASLYSWSPACVGMILELATDSDSFGNVLEAVEDCLSRSQEDKPVDDAAQRLSDPGAYQLFERAVKVGKALELFAAPPLFSSADPVAVETIARISDLRPDSDPNRILFTSDRAFMRIFESVSKGSLKSASELLEGDLQQLVATARETPRLTELLEPLAAKKSWQEELGSIEAWLADATRSPKDDALSTEGRAIKALADPARGVESEAYRQALLGSIPFSSILPRIVLAYGSVRETLPNPKDRLSKEVHGDNPAHEKLDAVAAREALECLSGRPKLELCLQIRVEAARDYLELRTFAKLDALFFAWPGSKSWLRNERLSVVRLEERLLLNQPVSGDIPTELSILQSDRRFRDFLRLRPYLKDIYKDELEKFLASSATIPTSTAPTASQPPSPSPPKTRPELPEFQLLNIVFGKEAQQLKVTFAQPDGKVYYQGDLDVNLDEIISLIRRTRFHRGPLSLPGQGRDIQLVERVVDLDVRGLGELIWRRLFPEPIRVTLLDLFGKGARCRLNLVLQDSELSVIPWECLYIPDLMIFPALSAMHSIVRLAPPAIVQRTGGFEEPVRILAVLSNPSDTAPLNVKGEEEILRRVLAPAVHAGRARLQILGPDQSTMSEVRAAVRRLRPEVFHYVGHGYFDEQHGGTLVLGAGKKAEVAPADQVDLILSDAGVKLTVLNGCDTGNSTVKDAINSLAGRLVKKGVPAVIATMRPIYDEAALMFSRTFYSSLVEDEPVDGALTEARKALGIENWDWSAYALFSGTTELERLRLPASRQSA